MPRPIKAQTPPSATIEITVYATPKHVRAAAASAQPSPASSPMRRLPTQMSPEGDRTAVEEFDQDLPAAVRSGARSAGVRGGGVGVGGTSGGGGGIGAGVSAAASGAGQGAGSSQPGGSATTATAAAAAAAAAAAVAAIQRSTTPLGSGRRQLQQTLSFMVRRISAAIVAAPAEEVRTPERSGRSGGRTAVQGKSSDHVSHVSVVRRGTGRRWRRGWAQLGGWVGRGGVEWAGQVGRQGSGTGQVHLLGGGGVAGSSLGVGRPGWGWEGRAGWVFWGRTAVYDKFSKQFLDVVVAVGGAGFGLAPRMGLGVTLNLRPLGCRE